MFLSTNANKNKENPDFFWQKGQEPLQMDAENHLCGLTLAAVVRGHEAAGSYQPPEQTRLKEPIGIRRPKTTVPNGLQTRLHADSGISKIKCPHKRGTSQTYPVITENAGGDKRLFLGE